MILIPVRLMYRYYETGTYVCTGTGFLEPLFTRIFLIYPIDHGIGRSISNPADTIRRSQILPDRADRILHTRHGDANYS